MLNNNDMFHEKVPDEICLIKGKIMSHLPREISCIEKSTKRGSSRKKHKATSLSLRAVSSPGRILAHRRAAMARGEAVPVLDANMSPRQSPGSKMRVMGINPLQDHDEEAQNQLLPTKKVNPKPRMIESSNRSRAKRSHANGHKEPQPPRKPSNIPSMVVTVNQEANCSTKVQRWTAGALPSAEYPAPTQYGVEASGEFASDTTDHTVDSTHHGGSSSRSIVQKKSAKWRPRRRQGQKRWERYLTDDWDDWWENASKEDNTSTSSKFRDCLCLVMLLIPFVVVGLAVLPNDRNTENASLANYCECPACTEEVWNRPVYSLQHPTTTCGALVEHEREQLSSSWSDACTDVAVHRYPAACGACVPGCTDSSQSPEPLSNTTWLPAPKDWYQYSSVNGVSACSEYHEIGEDVAMEMCSEDEGDINTDGESIMVEARKGSHHLVKWIPADGAFGYGTYTWKLEYIRVLNDGIIASRRLPTSMALRFFLLDPFDDAYQVEIALASDLWQERDGDINERDSQNIYFGWSKLGLQAQSTGRYLAQDITISLDWHPEWLAWTAQFGAQTHFTHVPSISKDDTRTTTLPCLPRQSLEARMTLSDLTSNPTRSGEDSDVVQVKLASFSYTAIDALSEGDVCTRDCECQGELNICEGGRCTIV